MPVAKARGDEVFAGTVNGSGVLHLVVTRDPSQTVVARIVELVADASATKAKTQLFIEKIEQRYSLGMVAATLALIVIPLMFGADLRPVLLRAMTFMIVASPCAVVLATMPPLLSAIANAGRHGVLVKSAVVVERLADTSIVALDKTGTLTRGIPRLASVAPLDPNVVDARRLLQIGSCRRTIQRAPAWPGDRRGSSSAWYRHTARQGLPRGPGLRGPRPGGQRFRRDRQPAKLPRCTASRAGAAPSAGATAAIVLLDGVAIGVLGLTDQLRPDAVESVAAMAALTAAPPVLLTGDNGRAAWRVARNAGITDVRAALLPEQKVEVVRNLQAGGHQVLLVGDGVNDAPAMAAARAAVAMGAGADLTLQTADGVTIRDELHTIPTIIGLARQARRVVTVNLAIAATFIAVLVLWDLFGQLPLPLGVVGHEGSTVLVALNGMRLLTNRSWRAAASAAR